MGEGMTLRSASNPKEVPQPDSEEKKRKNKGVTRQEYERKEKKRKKEDPEAEASEADPPSKRPKRSRRIKGRNDLQTVLEGMDKTEKKLDTILKWIEYIDQHSPTTIVKDLQKLIEYRNEHTNGLEEEARMLNRYIEKEFQITEDFRNKFLENKRKTDMYARDASWLEGSIKAQRDAASSRGLVEPTSASLEEFHELLTSNSNKIENLRPPMQEKWAKLKEKYNKLAEYVELRNRAKDDSYAKKIDQSREEIENLRRRWVLL